MCWKFSASTAQEYITINITSKDDLTITCSIINPDQLAKLDLIQLKRLDIENGTTFDEVISVWNNDTSPILWKDKDLENRAFANGTIEEAKLRLFIDKESVQCFTDFTKYKCNMKGLSISTLEKVSLETDPVTASHIDACTCMYVYNAIHLILLKMNADLLNDILKKEMFVLFIKLYKL